MLKKYIHAIQIIHFQWRIAILHTKEFTFPSLHLRELTEKLKKGIISTPGIPKWWQIMGLVLQKAVNGYYYEDTDQGPCMRKGGWGATPDTPRTRSPERSRATPLVTTIEPPFASFRLFTCVNLLHPYGFLSSSCFFQLCCSELNSFIYSWKPFFLLRF